MFKVESPAPGTAFPRKCRFKGSLLEQRLSLKQLQKSLLLAFASVDPYTFMIQLLLELTEVWMWDWV